MLVLLGAYIKWALTVFTQRNFVADFLQEKCNFTRKTAFCIF